MPTEAALNCAVLPAASLTLWSGSLTCGPVPTHSQGCQWVLRASFLSQGQWRWKEFLLLILSLRFPQGTGMAALGAFVLLEATSWAPREGHRVQELCPWQIYDRRRALRMEATRKIREGQSR